MKPRLLHTLLILALLLPVSVTAVTAQTTDCPITPGKYDGTMNAALSFRNESEGSSSFVEMHSTGELHFTITCNHVTGTVTRTTGFAASAEQDNDTTVFDSSGTCVIKGNVAASNIVKNDNAPTELQVRIDFTEVTGEYIGGEPDGSGLLGAAAGTTIFRIQAQQGRTISGDWSLHYDNGYTWAIFGIDVVGELD